MKKGLKQVGSFGRWDSSRIDVYVDPADDGGSGRISEVGIRYLVIGLQDLTWTQVLDICVHEALETELMDMDVSYLPGNRRDMLSTRDRIFLLSHTDFAEAISRAAVILANMIPVVQKEFDKQKKASK